MKKRDERAVVKPEVKKDGKQDNSKDNQILANDIKEQRKDIEELNEENLNILNDINDLDYGKNQTDFEQQNREQLSNDVIAKINHKIDSSANSSQFQKFVNQSKYNTDKDKLIVQPELEQQRLQILEIQPQLGQQRPQISEMTPIEIKGPSIDTPQVKELKQVTSKSQLRNSFKQKKQQSMDIPQLSLQQVNAKYKPRQIMHTGLSYTLAGTPKTPNVDQFLAQKSPILRASQTLRTQTQNLRYFEQDRQNDRLSQSHGSIINSLQGPFMSSKDSRRSSLQQTKRLSQLSYYNYNSIKNKHNLINDDFLNFGDRAPSGYEKVRLLSKVQNQVYWIYKPKSDGGAQEQSEEEHCIIQQIPRCLPNFHKKKHHIEHSEKEVYQKLSTKQGLCNFIFEVKEVIDRPEDEDVWVVYYPEKGLEQFYSLDSLLWNISFDPSPQGKFYEVIHGEFYKILSRQDGKHIVPQLIDETCKLLQYFEKDGSFYGNLRLENIILRLEFSQQEKIYKIEKIKFLNFGHMSKVEHASNMHFPDKIDHLPPGFLTYLLEIDRFNVKRHDSPDTKSQCSDKFNLRFLQSAASADVFSLGVILFQIATGCPTQLQLPVKARCKTVSNKFYVTTPNFGHHPNWMVDPKYADQTIKMQWRCINNIDLLLSKDRDNYGLLKDNDFYYLLKRMVSSNYIAQRPNIREILNSQFMLKQRIKSTKNALEQHIRTQMTTQHDLQSSQAKKQEYFAKVLDKYDL